MKRYAVLVALGFILTAPCAAWSQSSSGGSGGNSGNGGGFQGNAQEDPAKFQRHKEEILQRIGEHISEMQKRQNCVQAANDRQALMACMPQGGEHGDWGQHGGGGFHHGGSGNLQGGAPSGQSSGGSSGESGGEPSTQ